MQENYYQILGLDNFATNEEIKKAYRNLAKKYHPDKSNGSEDKFRRVNEAYHKLSDPHSKALMDEWLRQPISKTYSTSNTQPRYKKRTSYYTSEKSFYTPKVKMYGTIFTIAFVMLAILTPIGIMYKASDYHYEQGIQFLESNQYGKAVMSFKDAITWFGKRSGDACIASARIGLDNLHSNDQANYFILKGFEYSNSHSIIGELHFLQGRLLCNRNEFKTALQEFEIASSYNYHQDSIALYKGIVNAFYLENFDIGIDEFDKILSHKKENTDALFGKAWCLQKLNLPLLSLDVYNQLLGYNENHVLGNFYRGHNNIVVGDTLQACHDFKKAMDLGYQPALIYYTNQCGNYLR